MGLLLTSTDSAKLLDVWCRQCDQSVLSLEICWLRSASVNSCLRGFFLGWNVSTPLFAQPWNPSLSIYCRKTVVSWSQNALSYFVALMGVTQEHDFPTSLASRWPCAFCFSTVILLLCLFVFGPINSALVPSMINSQTRTLIGTASSRLGSRSGNCFSYPNAWFNTCVGSYSWACACPMPNKKLNLWVSSQPGKLRWTAICLEYLWSWGLALRHSTSRCRAWLI